MSEPIVYIGIVLCLIWCGATLLVEKQKRKILIWIGGAVSVILLVYTLQWKLYVIGCLGGLFCGCIGIGYKQGELKEVHKEIGVVQTMAIFAILFSLLLMVLMISFPGLKL